MKNKYQYENNNIFEMRSERKEDMGRRQSKNTRLTEKYQYIKTTKRRAVSIHGRNEGIFRQTGNVEKREGYFAMISMTILP